MKLNNGKISTHLNRRALIFDISSIFFILSLVFIILESKHPFYFLSDDNRTFYLPMFIHNFRALTNGELAFFNFHQYLGIAHFSNFQSAIFYPLTYFSMFLSKIISGHEFWTIDIVVFIHLIIGSIGFYKLIFFFTKDRYSAMFGSLVWSLNSFSIFISNSWWIFSGVTAYFPWMLFFAFKLYSENSNKNLILLILFRILLFYVGHIEYFIYCMIFEFLTVTFMVLSLNTKKKDYVFFKKYLISYPITFIYALPILLPAWIRTKTSGIRSESFNFLTLHANGFNFSSWLQSLINPFNLRNDFYLRSQTKFSFDSFPHLSHIGYITLFLILFCIYYSLTNNNFRRHVSAKATIVVLFIFSLIWSFGWLAGLLCYIPILNRFRFPFKLLAFADFYLIFVASFGMYILSKVIKKQLLQNIIRSILILICIVNFILLYTNVYVSFNNRDHQDKIPLDEPFNKNLKNGRIFSLGISEDDPFSVKTLGFNYATLLDLNHFAGYDPLMPKKNFETCLDIKYRNSYKKNKLPIDYLRNWGVNWYNLNKDPEPNSLYYHYRDILEADSSIVFFADEPERTIFHDRSSNPLFYWRQTQTSKDIKVKMKTNSIQIHTNNSQDDHLIINYLFNDFFQVKLNNVKILPIKETKIGQMDVFVPKGNNKIEIKYKNPYYKFGVIIVFVFSLAMILVYYLKKYFLMFTKILK